MPDVSTDAQIAEWRNSLIRTSNECVTFYRVRNPYWIAMGSYIWAQPWEWWTLVGRSLGNEFTRAATYEMELRGELTRRLLAGITGTHEHLSASVVLGDCIRAAEELLIEASLDINADIVRNSGFVEGIEDTLVPRLISQQIERATERLTEAIDDRGKPRLGYYGLL